MTTTARLVRVRHTGVWRCGNSEELLRLRQESGHPELAAVPHDVRPDGNLGSDELRAQALILHRIGLRLFELAHGKEGPDLDDLSVLDGRQVMLYSNE